MNNDDILLSFIVPFYNVEKYIVNCIESLYKQDLPLESYEVIVVNDCSLDSCKVKVLELMKIYPTIKLIEHDKNKKQGAARNTGVDIAKGKYIWFIDSDDYIKPNTAGHLLNIALENDLDILHFDYTRVYDNGEADEYPTNYNSGIIDGNTFVFDENEIWWKKSIEVWRRLHKRVFLFESNLKFEEGVFYEDVTYSIEVFNSAKRVMHIADSSYCYRLNPNSFTNIIQSSYNLIESIKLLLRISSLMNSKLLDDRYIPVLYGFVRYQLDSVFRIIPNISKKEKKDFFLKMNSIQFTYLNEILDRNERIAFRYGNTKVLYNLFRFRNCITQIKSVVRWPFDRLNAL